VLHCVDEDAPEGPTPCSVSLDLPNETAKQHSALLRTYLHLDPTNKVRDFITTLRGFVKDQGIVGQTSGKEENNPCGQKVKTGCLSTYAWSVLAIHVLLKFQLLPNIHSRMTSATEEGSAERKPFLEKNVPENVMNTRPCRQNVQNNILYNKIMRKSSTEHSPVSVLPSKEPSLKKEESNVVGSSSPAECSTEVEKEVAVEKEVEKLNNLKISDDSSVNGSTQEKESENEEKKENEKEEKKEKEEEKKEKESENVTVVKEGKEGEESKEVKTSIGNGTSTESTYVCSTYAEKLSSVSVLDLFHLFFAYVSGCVDVFGTVLTLRGEGEVRAVTYCKESLLHVCLLLDLVANTTFFDFYIFISTFLFSLIRFKLQSFFTIYLRSFFPPN
jgi:hypothetical protein